MSEPRTTTARPRRGRRALAAAVLVGVFAASVGAGWYAADPEAAEAALAGLGRTPAATALPDATTAAAATSLPAPTASLAPTPASTPLPTASPASTPLPTASPSPRPTPQPVVPPAVAARLDRALAAAQKSLALPGVQATVIFADGTTWTGTRGLADVAAKRRVLPETPFAVASVTKTFTAALILRYVDQRRLRLDDRLSRWLPDWPNARRITIRMLLNHTSGIPDYFKVTAFDALLNKDRGRVWTVDEVLARYVRTTPVFPPGKGWSYSNTNYALLGIIAEKVGKAPWATLVHDELFEPYGLTSTYVQGVGKAPAKPARAYRIVSGNRAQARTDGTDVVPFTSVVTAAGSAGAIASTTQDLARWAHELYGGKILTAATKKEMLTFVRAYAYGLGTSYGLGVSRVRFGTHTAYGHTGALAGTRASIRYFAKDKVTVAVLFNRETYVGDDVVRILARALFPKTTASPSPGAGTRPTDAP